MKKLFLISTLLISQITFAKTHQYEVSPMIGYTFNDSYLPLNDYPIYGVETKFNQYNSILTPELSFYYERGKYDNGNSEQPDIYTIALRGVYDFTKYKNIAPFSKIGASNRTLLGNDDELRNAVFLDLGIGTKINFTDTLAFKIESLYMVNYYKSRINQHISILAGLNFAFGEVIYRKHSSAVEEDKPENIYVKPKKKNSIKKRNNRYMMEPTNIKPKIKELPKIAPLIIKNDAQLDGDNDGVVNTQDDCLNTPRNTKVNIHGCQIIEEDIILDNDIIETVEKETPPSIETDTCLEETYRKIANLNIKFKYKSFNLTEESKEKLFILTSFLQEKPEYNVKIIGYTDNVASKRYNKRLSKKRANAIKNMLIESQIDADRIYALGLGENYPVATNSTKEGRAKNRRTEIILLKE